MKNKIITILSVLIVLIISSNVYASWKLNSLSYIPTAKDKTTMTKLLNQAELFIKNNPDKIDSLNSKITVVLWKYNKSQRMYFFLNNLNNYINKHKVISKNNSIITATASWNNVQWVTSSWISVAKCKLHQIGCSANIQNTTSDNKTYADILEEQYKATTLESKIAEAEQYIWKEKTQQYVSEIKNLVSQLITWKNSDDEKIKAIYDWITQNISYDNNMASMDVDNSLSWNFTWIMAFKNRKWVCYSYADLMYIMLSFANIKDIQTIWWYIYKTSSWWWDIPLPHAWVRIGDYYYDPTWDKESTNYQYYKLPLELISLRDAKLYNQNSSKEERNKLYNEKFEQLKKKYNNYYPAFFGISTWCTKTISFEDFKQKVWKYIELQGNNFQFIEDGVNKIFTPIWTYQITQDEINNWIIISTRLDYSTSAIYKMNWNYYMANEFKIENKSF